MAGLLKEASKLFSLQFAMRSNIFSSNYGVIGSSGVGGMMGSGFKSSQSSIFSAFTASRQLSVWYQKMQELKDYENTELANTAISVYHDYLFSHFNETEEICKVSKSLDPDGKKSDIMNKIIKSISLVQQTKKHLDEIIYYGSYSYRIDWDKIKKTWIRYDLINPYNVLTVYESGKLSEHLILTRDGKLAKVAPHAVVRLGNSNFRLINDVINLDDNMDTQSLSQSEDTLINKYEILGGFPIFYNLIGKIKEYIIKDQIVSILSIKDLIQPLLLLIRVDKQTDPAEANRLAVNTENLINKYSDMSAIFGAQFSIMDLMDSILNNIRVLPDYQSTMGDMNSIDLSKISQKIQDIKSDQENSKDAIYSSLGIPRSLTSGDTTKWEAIKSSQRLNSKITGFMSSLTNSYQEIICTLYYLRFNEVIEPSQVEVNLFTKTDVDYNEAITNADIANQLLESVNRTVESAQRFAQDSKLVDKKQYLDLLTKQLSIIDPELVKLIPDKVKTKFLKDLETQESEGSSGGFGGGF